MEDLLRSCNTTKRRSPIARHLPRRSVLSSILLIAVTALRLEAGQIEASVSAKDAIVQSTAGPEGELRNRVEFAPDVDWPQLMLRPRSGVWDWSAATTLVVPVENPTSERIELLVRIDDDPHATGSDHTMGSLATIEPGSSIHLVVPLRPIENASLGMHAGPPPLADHGNENMAELARRKTPESVHGQIDPRHITCVHLSLRKGDRRTLIVGNLKTEVGLWGQGGAKDLVDGFGQFSRGSWPEKVTSVEDLKRRQEEEDQELAKWEKEAPSFDRFGGILGGPKFKATGYFRTEKSKDRWWLVTPEGHGFFSTGVDAVMVADGRTYIQGREELFRDLPAQDGPLAAHYGTSDSRNLAVPQKGRSINFGRYFNFYTANLERKYGPDYLTQWRANAIRRLKGWGFNTLGAWTEQSVVAEKQLPYTTKLTITGDFSRISSGNDHWGKMADPFDPRFSSAVDSIIRTQTASLKDDPNLIGYFVDNELSWGGVGNPSDPRKHYGLALSALAGGMDIPAKAFFVDLLRAKYRTPDRLAEAWGVGFKSWDELSAPGFSLPMLPSEALIGDLKEFTKRYADKYFQTIAEALKRNDPNHLYLGCRFAAQTEEAVAAAAQWCDVVSFNIYHTKINSAEKGEFRKLGKPVIIGEFHFGSRDRGPFWGGMVDVGEENKRGPAYEEYVMDAVADGDIVGCHWFQYVDQPITGRLGDGENGHVGLVSAADIPYRPFIETVRTTNLKVMSELAHLAD